MALTITNVKNLQGNIETFVFKSPEEKVLDVEGKLTLLPALIDPHVHMRTPGHNHKEDWIYGARAAIAGGVTTVFDMPNNKPACTHLKEILEKKRMIDRQLKEADIPLHYYLFLGADQDHLNEIGRAKEEIIGIKVYMGSSTGGLVMANDESLERVFQIAGVENLLVAVHAEDEEILQSNQQRFADITDPAVHSQIRDRSAAVQACQKAILLAEKYAVQLFILHISTKEEVELIREAKRNHLMVYAETTPHHLFLTEKDYAKWGTKVQVNPPIRTEEDQEALWKGIHDGTIDTIGSDHAPHTLEEKALPYGQSPSGIPGVETTLPLLLNACHEGKISFNEIIALTRQNAERIYRLPHNEDAVLVDVNEVREVEDRNLKTKCGWSPFTGRVLRGWPVYTILNGRVFHV